MKPNPLQMLEVAEACGLVSVREAFQNYMDHYDCFFLISDYPTQYAQFVKDLISLDLVILVGDNKFDIVDLPIASVLPSIRRTYDDQEST